MYKLKKFRDYIKENKKVIVSLLLIIVIYKLVLFLSAFLFYYYTFNVEAFNVSQILDIWSQWDANAYVQIAEGGYTSGNTLTRYFPLFPIIVSPLGKVLGYKFAAYFVNTFALFFFLFGLHKLIRIDFDKAHAWRAILYYLVFPTAIFLTGYYSECLFLALTVWTFYFVRKGNWQYAGMLGLLASLTRIEGVVLFFFMFYEYAQSIDFNYKRLNRDFIYCFFPALGVVIYGLYLHLSFGDFFIFLRDHAASDKKLTLPWESIGEYLAVFFSFEIFTSPYYVSRVIDLIFFIISMALGIVVIFKLRISYALYVIMINLMVTFTGDLGSTNRRSLLYFPIVILLAKWGKSIVFNFFVIVLFGNLFSLFLLRYIFGFWTG